MHVKLSYIHFLWYCKGRQIFHKCSRVKEPLQLSLDQLPFLVPFQSASRTNVRLAALLLETKWGCGRISNRNIVWQMSQVKWVRWSRLKMTGRYEFASPVLTDGVVLHQNSWLCQQTSFKWDWRSECGRAFDHHMDGEMQHQDRLGRWSNYKGFLSSWGFLSHLNGHLAIILGVTRLLSVLS